MKANPGIIILAFLVTQYCVVLRLYPVVQLVQTLELVHVWQFAEQAVHPETVP